MSSRTEARGARTAAFSQPGARQTRARDYVVPTLVAMLIIFSLDTELLSVIPLLGAIRTEYGLSPTQAAWALSATGIAAGATVPLMSRFGDIFGLRRMLLVTLAITAIGNVICAAATSPAVFILGRVIVGINAGLPLYYAILRARSHSREVADRYAGLMTVAIGFTVCLSFFYGGLIIEAGGSVRTALWIIAAISIAVLAVVWLLVDEVPIRARIGVDWLGVLLLGAAFAALVTGISQANAWGWGSAKVLGLIAVSLLLFLAWGLWELRHRHPLIDLREVGRRAMWPGFIVSALAGVIGVNGLLIITLYVQTPGVVGYGFGASVLVTALYLLPGGLAIGFGGALVAPFIERVGQRTAALLGGAAFVVLFVLFSQLSWSRIEVLVMCAVLGLAYALCYTAGVTVYLRAARPGAQGMITGTQRAASTAFMSIGPALVTTLLTASLIPGTPVPQKGNYSHVWLVWAGLGALAFIAALFIRETRLDDRPVADVEPATPVGAAERQHGGSS